MRAVLLQLTTILGQHRRYRRSQERGYDKMQRKVPRLPADLPVFCLNIILPRTDLTMQQPEWPIFSVLRAPSIADLHDYILKIQGSLNAVLCGSRQIANAIRCATLAASRVFTRHAQRKLVPLCSVKCAKRVPTCLCHRLFPAQEISRHF